MVLYKDLGFKAVGLKWQGLINNANIVFGLLIVAWLVLGFMTDWDFTFLFVGFYLTIAVLARLFFVRKWRPIWIESLPDGLRIVSTRYFITKDQVLPDDDVKIEFYDSPYNQKSIARPSAYYLYFYSHSDKSVDIEISSSYGDIAKLLDSIKQEQRIYLGPRELNVIQQYQEAVAWSKTTKGKLTTIGYYVIYFGLMALIVYMCTGKS